MSIIEQKKIARVFKKIREENNLTQQELADKLYCDIRQVRRYETDGTDKLTVINLYADIFKLDSLSILSMSLDAFLFVINRTFDVLTLYFSFSYNVIVSMRC